MFFEAANQYKNHGSLPHTQCKNRGNFKHKFQGRFLGTKIEELSYGQVQKFLGMMNHCCWFETSMEKNPYAMNPEENLNHEKIVKYENYQWEKISRNCI